jgi:hypothetical protein
MPSFASRLAPSQAKGLALGVYNTTQALGLFTGGALGGMVYGRWGGAEVFMAVAVLTLLWLVVAPGMRRWPGRGAPSGPGMTSGQPAVADLAPGRQP